MNFSAKRPQWSTRPFSSPSGGLGAARPIAKSAMIGRPAQRMGGFFDDILDPTTWGDKVNQLLAKIPQSDPKWQEFANRFDHCADLMAGGDLLDLGAAGKCFYDLYKDVKERIDEREEEERRAQQPPSQPPQQPSSGIGITTVLLAVAAGAGLILILK